MSDFYQTLSQMWLLQTLYKRHELVHNGGFQKFEALYCSQNTVESIKIQLRGIVFQTTKISGELKSCNRFLKSVSKVL